MVRLENSVLHPSHSQIRWSVHWRSAAKVLTATLSEGVCAIGNSINADIKKIVVKHLKELSTPKTSARFQGLPPLSGHHHHPSMPTNYHHHPTPKMSTACHHHHHHPQPLSGHHHCNHPLMPTGYRHHPTQKASTSARFPGSACHHHPQPLSGHHHHHPLMPTSYCHPKMSTSARFRAAFLWSPPPPSTPKTSNERSFSGLPLFACHLMPTYENECSFSGVPFLYFFKI